MGDAFRITVNQGNQLFRDCFLLDVPDKIEGIGAWNVQFRSATIKNIRQFKKALAQASEIFLVEKQIHFGPRDLYLCTQRPLTGAEKEREVDDVGEIIEHKYAVLPRNGDVEVEVELTGESRRGAFAVCLLRTHPGPLYRHGKPYSWTISPGRQDELIWPVAEALGFRRDLEAKLELWKDVGLAFKGDEEYDSEKAKENAGEAAAPPPAVPEPARG